MGKSKKFLFAIFLVLMVFVGVYFIGIRVNEKSHEDHYMSRKKAQVIQQALNEYIKKCGSYPSSDEGLSKLKINNDSCGYIASEDIKVSDEKDASGENFVYSSDGKSYQLKTSSGIELTKENSIFERK